MRAKKQCNKDLHAYRNSSLSKKTNKVDKLYRFLVHIALLAIWKSLGAISVPLRKCISLYVWMGKSSLGLASLLQEYVFRIIGWMVGPAFSRGHHFEKCSRYYFGYDLRRWQIGLVLVVATSIISSLIAKLRESFNEFSRRRKRLEKLMNEATNYEQWKGLAEDVSRLDEQDPACNRFKKLEQSKLYDQKLLVEKTLHLKRTRGSGNIREMMFALRTDLIRNIANIAKSQLHEHFIIMPETIKQYIHEVKEQLTYLANLPDDELPLAEKLAFFQETRHAYGRTALLLSGGGGLGTFHIGVVKTLFEHQLLPRVLAGSSVGSIVAGIVATRTDMELRDLFVKLDQFDIGFFKTSRAVELVQHLVNKGSLHDMAFMVNKLRGLLGDATFLEAYERTGRILNVTVCPADTNEPPRLLNYLTSPHALIWSAVAASAAFPGLFPAQNILARNSAGDFVQFSPHASAEGLQRRWRDGSLELDLPTQVLGELFNCNHFLVSQTNPHIVPLLNLVRCLSRKWGAILEAEVKHRCQLLQWLLPDWVPSKWLSLFTQPWSGDITMVLPARHWHLGKAITNPTTPELLKSVRVGEMATWTNMGAITCNCTIEAALDKCLASLSNRARGRPLSRMGNRVPSWMHMPAMGLPVVASWGDNLGDMDGAVQASACDKVASWATPEPDLPGVTKPLSHNVLARIDAMNPADVICIMPTVPASPDSMSERDDDMGSVSASVSASVTRSAPRGPTALRSMIELAQADCTDASADLWSNLLPLARQAVMSGADGAGPQAPGGPADDQSSGALDVFAY